MRTNTYRIDIRFRDDRMLVSLEGPPGPEAARHLEELRRAADRCHIDIEMDRPDSQADRRWPDGSGHVAQ